MDDGKKGCGNAVDHQHTGTLGAETTYYCNEFCPLDECPESLGKRRL